MALSIFKHLFLSYICFNGLSETYRHLIDALNNKEKAVPKFIGNGTVTLITFVIWRNQIIKDF